MEKEKTIRNRIIKQDFVEWRKCKWLQPDDLKKYTKEQWKKFKTSLVNNGFAAPFYVWENKEGIWILDAHHRQKAMIELIEIDNVDIPSMLPAVFIQCANKAEAKKAVLIYNSHYANIQQDSLEQWIADLDFDDIIGEIDIKNIYLAIPDFQPCGSEEQARLDEKSKQKCPKCGHEY